MELYSNYQSGFPSGSSKTMPQGFTQMLLPYDGSFAARLLHKKQAPELSKQSLSCLKELFSELFSLTTLIKETRCELYENGVDLHKVFSEMDQTNKGYLDKEDLRCHLQNHINDFKEGPYEELTIFAAKCDLDKDGKIGFVDFFKFLSL